MTDPLSELLRGLRLPGLSTLELIEARKLLSGNGFDLHGTEPD